MVKGGLEDIIATESSICNVDGKEGRLVYQGYDIHELAEHSSFEEVVYLLWNRRLPTKTELETLSKELRTQRKIPADVVKFMQFLPKSAPPMEVLRTAASMLSLYDPDDEKSVKDVAANVRKATRLTAQLPTIVAHWDNIRNGKPPIAPRDDSSLATNFLYMLTGNMPDELSARALDIDLILHADHELNASTFAARVTASTESDIYSATVGAIGALKGPLHGGAAEEVMKMLKEIGEPSKVDGEIKKRFAENRKVPGFGHRVYKTEDPRASHLRQMSKQLGDRAGQPQWFEMSARIEQLVKEEKVAKEGKPLYPNVDFYSASTYFVLGIPIDLFTPLFAVSRMSGWAAHVLEQYSTGRLIRPRAEYTGPSNLKYQPIDKR